MLFAMLAAANAIAQPLPKLGKPIGNMPEWIRDTDYSSINSDGSVRFRVLFTPDGKPEKCTVVATSGNIAVEKLICVIVFKRFGFEKSLNGDAEPAYRILERAAHFGTQRSMPAEFATPPLATVRIPGLRKMQRAPVVVSVNKAGALVGCSAVSNEKKLRLLAETACQAVQPLWKAIPESNMSSESIDYLRDGQIELNPLE